MDAKSKAYIKELYSLELEIQALKNRKKTLVKKVDKVFGDRKKLKVGSNRYIKRVIRNRWNSRNFPENYDSVSLELMFPNGFDLKTQDILKSFYIKEVEVDFKLVEED